MYDLPVYKVIAVKYAHHRRDPSLSFIHPVDIHESEAALDFFVWAAVSKDVLRAAFLAFLRALNFVSCWTAT